MERAVFQVSVEPTYGFLDDPEWDLDIHREECLFVLDVEKRTDSHACNRSVVYDDMTGYVDAVQSENLLPEGKYIVTYWTQDGESYDLLQMADIGLTKDEIIENVVNQKYREGADYFLMPEEE